MTLTVQSAMAPLLRVQKNLKRVVESRRIQAETRENASRDLLSAAEIDRAESLLAHRLLKKLVALTTVDDDATTTEAE